jgi:hypothetical protein
VSDKRARHAGDFCSATLLSSLGATFLFNQQEDRTSKPPTAKRALQDCFDGQTDRQYAAAAAVQAHVLSFKRSLLHSR